MAFLTTPVFAAGAEIISYYSIILGALGVDPQHKEEWKPVLGAILTSILVVGLGLYYRKSVDKSVDAAPPKSVSLTSILDLILEFVHNLGKGIIGEKECRPYLSTLFALFIFIYVSNLSGLVPGFTPATESLNTNLVLGLFSFAVFNMAGIREHGIAGYLRTYCGPLLVMAPLIFLIEMIGALARPLSLALRLYGNIFGDHLVLAVFTGLTYLVLPALLLFFGLLVASIQSFVFTLLSSIYISLAVSHDH
ncbi:MAG: F0F1 ATP synthase subunit A [Oligoflexus sp.]